MEPFGNLLIGVPISALWDQGLLFLTAIIVITIVFLFPKYSLKHWEQTGLYTDAVGLSAFAIQGALYATEMNHPISAILVAALLTGSGGGMLRDVLAGRKALLLQKDIYGVWGHSCRSRCRDRHCKSTMGIVSTLCAR